MKSWLPAGIALFGVLAGCPSSRSAPEVSWSEGVLVKVEAPKLRPLEVVFSVSVPEKADRFVPEIARAAVTAVSRCSASAQDWLQRAQVVEFDGAQWVSPGGAASTCFAQEFVLAQPKVTPAPAKGVSLRLMARYAAEPDGGS